MRQHDPGRKGRGHRRFALLSIASLAVLPVALMTQTASAQSGSTIYPGQSLTLPGAGAGLNSASTPPVTITCDAGSCTVSAKLTATANPAPGAGAVSEQVSITPSPPGATAVASWPSAVSTGPEIFPAGSTITVVGSARSSKPLTVLTLLMSVSVTGAAPSLSNVNGAPSDPIGLTFGYDASHPTVTGTGFAPNESITLTENGAVVGSGTADGQGNLSTTITVPQQPDGHYTLFASGKAANGLPVAASSTLTSGGEIFVRGTAAHYCDATAGVWVYPTEWDGAGLDAGATYMFATSTGFSVTARASANGTFSGTFNGTAPPNSSPTFTITGPMTGIGIPNATFGRANVPIGSFGAC